MGKTGISYNDLFYLSIDDLFEILEGFSQVQQDEWERSRMIAHWSSIGYRKKGSKPKDIIEFPWEKKKEKMTTSKAGSIKEKGDKLAEMLKAGKIKFNK